MTILSRITRLVKADVHGILDGLEDPLVILKQAVREMEDAIAADGEYEKELAQKHERSVAKRLLHAKAFAEIENQLDLCFANAQESLAKSFVRKKLETRRRIEDLDNVVESIRTDREAILARITERQEKLARVAERVSALEEQEAVMREKSSARPEHVPGSISQEEVEIAFISEQQKRAQSSAHAGS